MTEKHWAYRQPNTNKWAFRVVPKGKVGWTVLGMTLVLQLLGSWTLAAGLTGLTGIPSLTLIGGVALATGIFLLIYTLKFKTDYSM